MASLIAEKIAHKVIEKVIKGEKPNVYQLQKDNGYSEYSSKAMKAVGTKSYQMAITKALNRMNTIRQKALQELSNKDLSKERYSDLIDGVDKMTKNIQLLTGKATENVASNVVVYGSDDFLALQLNVDKK